MFLFYVLWRLANIESTKTVILHRQMNHKRIYVFQNGGCWIVSSGADIQMFLTDPDTWYLTDALLTPPDSVEAVTILVSSPAEKYYSDFLKYSSTSPLHYLPTWSLDELKRVAHVYSKSPEEVEKRFNMIGGVPRYVLEKDVNLEETINEKIGKLLLKNIMLLPTFEGATEKEISHRLVHFEVKPPCYTKYEPVIASQCVRRKYAEARRDRLEQMLRSVFSFFKNVSYMGASIGFLFESHANRQLSAGGKFRMRSLDDKIETEIELSPRTSQIFQDISECTNPNIYYIAEQNFPCIDSLIVGVGYFQITISSKHDIKKNQMKGIKNKPNMKMKKFYFVVPDTHYEAFKKQRLTEDRERGDDLEVIS